MTQMMPHDRPDGLAENSTYSQARRLRDSLLQTNARHLKEMLAGFPELTSVILRNAPFAGCDLRDQDLSGLDFTGANLIGARFAGARISGARFDQARVARWQLREAADWHEHVISWRPASGVVPKFVSDGDRFSDTPFSPEMVLVPVPGDPSDGTSDGLLDDERAALQEGRLAVAVAPVTIVQYTAFLRSLDRFQGWHDDGVDLPRPMQLAEARQYLDWLRTVSATDYRIPSEALWRHLVRCGGAPALSHAVTTDSYRGLKNPLPIDTRAVPGSGRCDRLGLYDMIGNVREFVLKADSGRVLAIGGHYDESFAVASALDVLRDVNERHQTARNGLRLVRLFNSAAR